MKKRHLLWSGRGITFPEVIENVLFVGEEKDQKILAIYYSMADVFVIFSKRETYSMTCAEALCCGTPVVGFKCGAPETVFPDHEACFFEYGEIEVVKEYIVENMYG